MNSSADDLGPPASGRSDARSGAAGGTPCWGGSTGGFPASIVEPWNAKNAARISGASPARPGWLLAVHVPWYQGSPRILSGGASISACTRRPTGIVFLVRCARCPLAARRLHSRSVRPRRNHGARPCRALLAWIYQTEVPAGLPASITGRRLGLRAHERTAESTAGDGVAAAVTGIRNRCIRHAARYRQGSAARRAQERRRG